jgi:hypothetical protein
MDNRQLKNKILDRANEICYERFSTSLYNICGLDVNDAGYIKEVLLSDSLSEIKSMGVGTFISSIPILTQMLSSNPFFGSKDRALRQLYDNRTLIGIMEKIDSIIEKHNGSDENTLVESVASEIAEEAIYLAKY